MRIRREWFEKDYYAVLGVPKNALPRLRSRRHIASSRSSITRTRTPAIPNAEERFKEISAAYDVIGDEDKRVLVRPARVRWARPGSVGGFPNSGGAGGGFGGYPGGVRFDATDVNLEDLLGGMFGGGSRRRARPSRGADLETEVTLSFDDAMAGVTVPVTLTGAGAMSDVSRQRRGAGDAADRLPDLRRCGADRGQQGLFSMAQTCPQCRGTGRLIETPCPTCGGSGATAASARSRSRCRPA